MFLLAGIIAALFAYLLNRLVLSELGNRGLITLVPFIEEMVKSTAAVYFKSAFISTHLVFGCIEGIYDLLTSSKKIGKWAALASIISHGFFGWITSLVYRTSTSMVGAILVAWIFHSGWNWYITKYL